MLYKSNQDLRKSQGHGKVCLRSRTVVVIGHMGIGEQFPLQRDRGAFDTRGKKLKHPVNLAQCSSRTNITAANDSPLF